MSNAIIASPSALRMVSTVSPVYDDSVVAAWLFEVVGRELDSGWALVGALPAQCSPNTCTWAIELWEEKYGLIPAPTLSLVQRRARLLSVTGMRGSINPAKLAAFISQSIGADCTIVENVTLYSFRILFSQLVSDPDAVLTLAARLKPTHLSCEVKFELAGSGSTRATGVIIGMGGAVALTQTN